LWLTPALSGWLCAGNRRAVGVLHLLRITSRDKPTGSTKKSCLGVLLGRHHHAQEVDERAACRPFFHMWRDAYGLAAEGYAPDELMLVPSSVWLCRCVLACVRTCVRAHVARACMYIFGIVRIHQWTRVCTRVHVLSARMLMHQCACSAFAAPTGAGQLCNAAWASRAPRYVQHMPCMPMCQHQRSKSGCAHAARVLAAVELLLTSLPSGC
jgi:hypothetical protein